MTNEPRKPKRKYTVTERVLVASRLNFEKARKAALERRFCATRGTDAEHDAAHAGLEAAQRIKRKDNTYKYCSVFRHGLLVANLERSLVMAGESREDYYAHLARFAALPAVFDFDAASDQAKLAQACGFASWRRLRAFRLHSEWALRMMVHHLHAAIRLGQSPLPSAEAQAKGEGETSLASFGNAFRNLVTSSAAQSGPVISSAASRVPSLFGGTRDLGAARNLALRAETGRDSSSPSAPRNDSFNEPIQNLVARAPSLKPEEFLELGRGLRWAAESWPGVWQPITQLNNRFDQLWCMLVSQLGEPVPRLNEYFLECARMRTSPVVAVRPLLGGGAGQPAAAAAAPRGATRAAAGARQAGKDWPCASRPYEVQERWEADFRHREAEAKRLGRPVSLMGTLDYRVLREARKPREESQSEDEPRLGVELPKSFEEFLALVEAAFGETRDSGSMAQCATSGTGTPACACPEPRKPNTESRNPASDPGLPASSPAPTTRDLAQLLWDSATLPRRRAEQEARLLADYLTEYAALLATRDAKDQRRRRRLADSILMLFRQGIKQQEESVGVTRRARLALHDIAADRYGRRPEWSEQLLRLNDRFKQHQSEFFDLYSPNPTGRQPPGTDEGKPEEGGKRRETRGKRQKPRGRNKQARREKLGVGTK